MTNEYGFEIPLVSEEECKLQERIEELEKANEWHYVKDGDLPKHDYGQFLVYVSFLHEKGESGWVDKNGDPVPTYYCKVTWFREKYGFDKDKGEDIIAWKKIIPPKEIE